MSLYIGGVELPSNVILAPMAGVSDLVFRRLCHEQGAGLVCMEMVSAKAISYHNRNTAKLLEIYPDEHPVSLQLFGSEPDLMAEVAHSIEELPFDILDINMGCPVPKVVRNGEGSALMQNPKLAGKIIYKVSHAISKPLTVKIRKGFDDGRVNAVEIAKIAEESGAAAVAVHGRTREQYYSGTADWDIIRQVKDAISIPVIGNGDVTSPETAKAMLDETGCDGVMIARAAQGNPWIFHRTRTFLETGVLEDGPTMEERRAMMIRHARMLVEYKGGYTGVREMRKNLSWYTAGLPNSAALRRKINSVESLDEMVRLIEEAF